MVSIMCFFIIDFVLLLIFFFMVFEIWCYFLFQ